MNPTFWRGRNVLVTGHTGFKGAWLSTWLSAYDACVTGFALAPPTTPNLFDVADVATLLNDVRGDVCCRESVERVVQDTQPEVIFHLAAQPLVRASYDDPVGTYATNVMGVVNVLEAARHCRSVRAVVVVTSDKCYENRERMTGYQEGDPMGGFDPYSSSKGCAELVTSAYRRSYFQTTESRVGLATVRAGNVIGGGDWAADRLIPDIINSLANEETITIRNPHAVRPWQHVMEPLRGYMMVAERLCLSPQTFSCGWNFGPTIQDTVTVGEVVSQMVDLWGSGSWETPDQTGEPHEAKLLSLDCCKAQQELQWTPQLCLRDALRLTVEWYRRASANNADMVTTTLSQIHDYAAGSASRRVA